jgi:hypothetical protein
MELITGRIHGYYLACYTVATREGYYGYAKVCVDKPMSVWQLQNVLRKVGAGPYPEEKDALLAVRLEGERRLAFRLTLAQESQPERTVDHPLPLADPRIPCPAP